MCDTYEVMSIAGTLSRLQLQVARLSAARPQVCATECLPRRHSALL